MTIQELAKIALDNIERKQRPDDSSYLAVKADAPEWVGLMIREAHDVGDLASLDDLRHEYIRDALTAITDADANEAEDDPLDAIEDGLDPDVYTADLTGWLGSHVLRSGYYMTEAISHAVDKAEARANGDIRIMAREMRDLSMSELMQNGQALERYEVAASVCRFLADQAEEADDE